MPARSSDHPYRFSRRFIQRATAWILAGGGVLLVAGFAVGFASDGVDDVATHELLSDLGIAIVVAAFGLPLLVAAVLGGESLARGAGFVGFGLIAGMAATIAAAVPAWFGPWQPLAFWGGIAVMALAVVGFWVVGWVAGAPMWIGLPMLRSPRLLTVQRRRDARAADERDADRSGSGTPPGT